MENVKDLVEGLEKKKDSLEKFKEALDLLAKKILKGVSTNHCICLGAGENKICFKRLKSKRYEITFRNEDSVLTLTDTRKDKETVICFSKIFTQDMIDELRKKIEKEVACLDTATELVSNSF